VTAPHLSVVVPAYHEIHRLPASLDVMLAWLAGQPYASELVVVDDGSTDGTADLARRRLAGFPHQVLVHGANRGKGAAVRTGMLAARGAFVLFTDADLSTPIDEAERFLALHAEGAPVVIGTRKAPGAQVLRRQSVVRERMGRVYTWLSSVLVCPGVTDFTCGFKSFRADAARRVFSRLLEPGWAYDTELLFLVRRLGYPVREVPVRWTNDESTRVRLLRDTVGSLAGLARIRWRAASGAYRLAEDELTPDLEVESRRPELVTEPAREADRP
jgi:dolichyl-phosphate beta-glucosyltransferase